MMDVNDVEFKELVYLIMSGSAVTEIIPEDLKNVITDEYEEGRVCEVAYQRLYEASRRICKRFNVEEDDDVECILTNYSLITKFMSMKMFDYGSLYLQDEHIQKLISFYKTLPDKSRDMFINFIDAFDKVLHEE